MNIKNVAVALGAWLLISTAAHAAMADRLEHKKIAGIDVYVYPMPVKQVVTISGALPAGDGVAVAHQEPPAVATLTAMMLDRGTTKQDKISVARKLGSVGASVEFSSESQSVRLRAQCLTKDLSLVLALIGEQLRTPAFSASEFDKARQQLIGTVQNYKEQVGYRADEAFKQQIYPGGSPNREPTLDELEKGAAALKVEDLKAFHRKYYGPQHMTLVLVGDVRLASIEKTLASVFQGWTGGVPYVREQKEPASQFNKAQTVMVEIPGKTSTVLMVGQATDLRYEDRDTIPLQVATAVFGSGFTGRLMHAVRDTEGLTYAIGAGFRDNTYTAGGWAITGTFAPELLERGVQSTRRELTRWWSEGITAEELRARKANLIGAYKVSLADTGGVAGTILQAALRNKGMDWLDQYPKAIAAVTLEDANGAIRRNLDPDKMIILKAGTLPKT